MNLTIHVKERKPDKEILIFSTEISRMQVLQ